MDTTTFLVTGATGNVGRHVVAELLRQGHAVRALTREPAAAALPAAVDVREGSLAEPPPGLFEGVTGAFVFPADGAADLARSAAQAGVERLVLLSSLAAALEHERDHGTASAVHHAPVEEAVRESGAGWTILRPGTFAVNLLAWSRSIVFTGGVRGPYPTSAQAPVHEADVGAVAALALTRPDLAGAVVPITGPEALTRVEQLDAIGRAVGRGLTFTEQPPEEFRTELEGYGVDPGIVSMMLAHWAGTVAEPDPVRSVEPLLGRPGLTLEQWARDHAQEFAA
ncbi:SDR family oxidoreductase [Microlunatus flavus]|uniref:Uncharacterized conserved protein YbjT, contains NAD(P)-binding and DUF2867 domains n=1 Tax=Microlunatus flavus TaxID=1036181 RepID=A0A1H9ICH7_9ACTN|nr:NAD(P)H-binding protein [Microlunatus flavus]SEQ72222.1 Uncharacterized conserved protein YbjT, contains NAD(P)-binding and DUF2867 domains [Microlunatus flavus]